MRSTWTHTFLALFGVGILAVMPMAANGQVRTNPAAPTQNTPVVVTTQSPTVSGSVPATATVVPNTGTVVVPNTATTIVPNTATGQLAPQLSPQTPLQMRSRLNGQAPTAGGSLQGGASPRFRGNYRIGGATGLQNDTRIFQSNVGVFDNQRIVTPQVVAPAINSADINQNGIDDRIDSVGVGVPVEATVVAPTVIDASTPIVTRGFVIQPFEFQTSAELSPIVQQQMIRIALESGFPITSGQLNTDLGTNSGGAGAMMNSSTRIVDWNTAFRPAETQ